MTANGKRLSAAVLLLVLGLGAGYVLGRAGAGQGMAAAAGANAASAAEAAAARATSSADGAPAASLQPVPVEIQVVAAPRAQSDVRATGTLRYQREIPLGFKVAGVVREVTVDIGDRVRAGTLLARLDPAEVSARQRDAQAMVDNAQRDYARTQVMVSRGFMSPAALDNAQMVVDRARATRDALAFDAARAVIRAPADGVVLSRLAEPGQVVAPGSAVVLFGDASSGLVLVAPLSDREVARVREGDAARIAFAALPAGAAASSNGAEVAARVSRVAAMADPRTGAFDVELRIAARAAGLRSGLVGEARIAGALAADVRAPSGRDASTGVAPAAGSGTVAANTIGVSALAVLEGRGDRASVYRVDAAGLAHRVPIRIDGFRDDEVLVAEGLQPGDRIVTAGAAYLRNGQPVRIMSAAPRT